MYRHDTTPSFLKHALDREEKDERSPKKARLSDAVDSSLSISSKLSAGAYPTLSDLRRDAEKVSESLVSTIRAEANERENSRLQVDDLKQIRRIQAFYQVVKDVVEQEGKYEAVHGTKTIKQEDGITVNGVATSKKEDATAGGGTVLTLFGNAPTPKQLFSSMQRPTIESSERMIKTELPVEEMSLPTGLAATKIMPVTADRSKKGPTFEDSFAPAHNLPQLQPPKSHKRTSTRDSTSIMWEFKDQLPRNKKGGYTTQSLSVGDWLGYGGLDAKDEPTSPREKRKLRDRALSGGESTQPAPRKESFADALAKEEEALFKRAYSSFAPSYDNSKAIVPQETKSMVWWNKVGQGRYNETFAIDPALLDERPVEFSDVLYEMEEVKIKDEDFGKVIDELDDLNGADIDSKIAQDKTNVEQVLREISELLETLASHQRIRNASLGASASVVRTPISPAPTLSSRIGRPDSPAEDEMFTYYSLRRELAYLILKLPPYAVAKLDGDQLAELGVSRLLTFQGRDTKGTMEEDQLARLAKYTAMATAAGVASLTRPGSQSGQHYSSTSQRTPAIGQAANTRYGQSAQFGPSRTPVQPAFQRTTSNQSSYGAPSATAPRPGYGQQPNQYTRPQSFGQTNGQQYYRPQPTPGGYAGYSQQYGSSTPQTQTRPTYSLSQPLAQYQQRAATNATTYQTNQQAQPSQSPFTQRTASPLKPAPASYPPAPSPGPTQQRPQFPPQQTQPGSGRTTPANNYPSQPHTPVNGYGQRPVAPAPRTGSGTPQPQNIQPAPPTAQTNGHA